MHSMLCCYLWSVRLREQFKTMATTRTIPGHRNWREEEITLLQAFMRLILLVSSSVIVFSMRFLYFSSIALDSIHYSEAVLLGTIELFLDVCVVSRTRLVSLLMEVVKLCL